MFTFVHFLFVFNIKGSNAKCSVVMRERICDPHIFQQILIQYEQKIITEQKILISKRASNFIWRREYAVHTHAHTCRHQIYLINVITQRKTKTIFPKWIANYILILISLFCYFCGIAEHEYDESRRSFFWSQNYRHSLVCGCCCRYEITMARYIIIISLGVVDYYYYDNTTSSSLHNKKKREAAFELNSLLCHTNPIQPLEPPTTILMMATTNVI